MNSGTMSGYVAFASPCSQPSPTRPGVRAGSLHAFLEIGRNAIHPSADDSKIDYYAKNAALDDIRGWIQGPINDRVRVIRLKEMGIDASTTKDLFWPVMVEGMGLVTVDAGTGTVKDAKKANPAEAIGIPMIMLFLMFLMVQLPEQLVCFLHLPFQAFV